MTEFEVEEEKSRSQLKRECKELVAELVELPSGRLRGIPITDGVRAAILAAQELERYPLKRQIGYIASRMDGEDVDAIRDTLSGAIPPTTATASEVVVDAADRRGGELIEGDDEVLSLFIDDTRTSIASTCAGWFETRRRSASSTSRPRIQPSSWSIT